MKRSSEDDYRTGCRNVSHCQQQQDYVNTDDQTQPTFVISIIISITHTITLGLPVVFSCPIF